jgi:type VI secretion system protein VasG
MPALSRRLLESLAARQSIAAAKVDWDDAAGDFRIDLDPVPQPGWKSQPASSAA